MNGPAMAHVLPVVRSGTADDRLAELFEDHHDRLFRLARRLTLRRDDALDLVQETFLRVARRPSSIPTGSADEEAWLVRILINIQRDCWRRAVVRERHDAVRHSVASTDSPEAALVARATIWRAIDVLPPRRRAVLVLYELEERSTAEIAGLLGITRMTVRWHLSKGRRDLARALRSDTGGINENR
jgi:RNA polymerase sigma-70 factor (ECF subfamily)